MPISGCKRATVPMGSLYAIPA